MFVLSLLSLLLVRGGVYDVLPAKPPVPTLSTALKTPMVPNHIVGSFMGASPYPTPFALNGGYTSAGTT